jgi:Zn ribbon nucleic-acid-binding protein
MLDLELVTVEMVRCRACGYGRTLTPAQADAFRRGEYFFGSKRCPACSHGCGGSAASWGNPTVDTLRTTV